MNTKLLMIASAIVLGTAGIMLSFAPGEIIKYLGMPEPNTIILQITGALYLGFAMLNWTAKGNLIGGIYSKPVAIGNFTHFLVGGIALAKLAFNNSGMTYTWIAAIVYALFAISFGYVSFTDPVLKNK